MKRSLLLLIPALMLLSCVGCWPNHEANVRERSGQFTTCLLQEDYETCAKLTDPAFIQQYGIQGAKLRYTVLGAFAKFGNIAEEKVRIDTITVDSEAKTATVNMSIQTGDDWTAINPQNWVRVDGEWYISL